MPDEPEMTTEEEDPNNTTRRSRTREQASKAEEETIFPARELLEYSMAIAEVDKPFAAGALRHAGVNLDEDISRERFKSIVKDFERVKVF